MIGINGKASEKKQSNNGGNNGDGKQAQGRPAPGKPTVGVPSGGRTPNSQRGTARGGQADDGFTDDLMDDDSNERESANNFKKMGIIGGIAVVIIILAFIIVPKLGSSSGSNEIVLEDTNDTDTNYETTEDSTASDYSTIDEEAAEAENKSFVDEEPDYSKSTQNQTTSSVVDSSEFVKNLQGEDVPVNYSVKNREYVKAYVNYTAKRAIIDDGMEMYWIDVVYKKKNYRAQVPFYYFKDLSEEGICRVEMEILNLENGGQIISYMQVVASDDGTD